MASLLPCFATFSQEEKEKKPEKESPGEATGSSEEAFEKLFAQFDKEKALEVYKRVATVEKFGIVPTPKSVDFLTKLYDQEKSSVIFEAVSRALGRIFLFLGKSGDAGKQGRQTEGDGNNERRDWNR